MNGDIEKCVHKLKNNKAGGSVSLVGELLKYGGVEIVDVLLFVNSLRLFGVKKQYVERGANNFVL